MISTLQKLVGMHSHLTHAHQTDGNFNANLPINVEVVKQIDATRYRLKVGRKELTTKSTKGLREGENYWGDFSQAKGGILTLSHLYKQPLLFQQRAYFLDIALKEILIPSMFSINAFKALLIQTLSSDTLSKEAFSALSYMLLAVSKEVVHLPLLDSGKRTLLQFKADESGYSFYAAFENLGPIEGTITPSGIAIRALYEKSLYFLDKVFSNLDKIESVTLQRDIMPLFDATELSLDLKG